MNDRIAVTQEMWDRAQAALLAALPVIEELVPRQSTQGNMINLRDQIRSAIYAPDPKKLACPYPAHVQLCDCQQWTEQVLKELKTSSAPETGVCGQCGKSFPPECRSLSCPALNRKSDGLYDVAGAGSDI